MEPLQTFLSSLDSQTKYRLSIQPTKGVFILSNSGKREDVKDFSLPINSLLSSLNDIKAHIESFTSKYNEDEWRKAGDYLSDNLAKSLFKSQTRPFFETLNKLLVWVSEGEYKDGEMPLTVENIDKLASEIVKIDFSNSTTENYLLQGAFSDSKMRLDLPYNRIVFGAPGTGKSYKLKRESATIENQKRIDIKPSINESVIKENVSEAITAPKGRKLTSLNAIGFKYADFWKEQTHLNKQEIKSFCNYPKIREIYVGAIAKFILDADALKMTEEELSDIAYIKALLHNDEKRGDNDKLKWANAIGYKMGESDDYANLSLKEIETELGLKGAQMWWLYRGIQAARLKEDEESISEEPFVERVTFHPNYSYAQFVGTYKPVQDDEDEKQIKYEYVPGPFMRVYRNAKKNPNNNFLLIIEEINRANVAAVFGDVFQLLDRKNGISEYPVAASEDIQKYLAKYGINERKLSIPDNMYIWATMNSADQGVFPMDTAFKRRWEFEYIGIDDNAEKVANYEIPIGRQGDKAKWKVKWDELRRSINDKLISLGINEDKLLGPYFLSESVLESALDKGIDFVKSFESKVLMYLFEDAAKMKVRQLFKITSGKYIYSEVCKEFEEKGVEVFDLVKFPDVVDIASSVS